MGGKLLANGRGRLLALVMSISLAGAMIYAQSAQQPTAPVPETARPAEPAPVPPPDDADIPAPAELIAASAPIGQGQNYEFPLPKGVAHEGGLQIRSIQVARAMSVLFPEIKTIGGYRQDPLKWHPNGLAIDVMIPNHNTEEGIRLGNAVAGFALANAERWGVIHVIWRRGLYPGIGAPYWTADYGSETANHYDHVHIATEGGGYPTGSEVYYLDRVERAGSD